MLIQVNILVMSTVEEDSSVHSCLDYVPVTFLGKIYAILDY